MSNLGPQQINQTYDNLLQVDGGLTNDLKPVLDGTGQQSGLYLGLGIASLTESFGNNFINVALQGVLPDKTGAENSSRMATIIADLWEAGGGSLYFPPGTYNFAEQILIEYPSVTSSSSITVGLGLKTFETNRGTQRGFAVGDNLNIAHIASDTISSPAMHGTIVSFDDTTLIVNISSIDPGLSGTYSSWVLSPNTDVGNINIIGAGPDISKLVFPNASNGIVFNLMLGNSSGTSTYAQNVYIRDFSLLTKNQSVGSGFGYCAITWNVLDNANNQGAPVFGRIQNVKMIGQNPYGSAWQTCIHLPSTCNVYIDACELTGQYGTYNAQNGLAISGLSVNTQVTNSVFQYLNYGVKISPNAAQSIPLNDIEGVVVIGCQFGPVNYGVYSSSTSTVNLPRTSTYVLSSHINASSACIELNDTTDSFISNNLLFIQGKSPGTVLPGATCVALNNLLTGTVTSATWSAGVATVTFTRQGLQFAGDKCTVYVSGMTPTGYNGVFDATVTSNYNSNMTVQYPLATNPGGSGIAFGTAVWQGTRHCISNNVMQNFSAQTAVRAIYNNTSYVSFANNQCKRMDIGMILGAGSSHTSTVGMLFDDAGIDIQNQGNETNLFSTMSAMVAGADNDPNALSWSVNGTTAYNAGNVVISNTLTSPLTGSTYGDLQYCSTQITGGGQNSLGGCLGLVQSSADVSCSLFGFFKTRSTTPSGVTALLANDDTGEVSYHGTDGTQYVKGSIITAVMDGNAATSGANSSMPMRLTFWTRNATFDSPGSYSNALKEAFRIDKDQNVYVTGLTNTGNTGGKFAIGINVTPTYEYTHNSRTSGIAAVTYYDGSTGGGSALNTTNGFSSTVPVYGFWYNENTGLGNPAANIVTVISNGAEKLRIDSLGNQFATQQTPFSVNTTATLNVGQLASRIIRSTTSALVTGTLPTGTAMDAWYSGAIDMGTDWSVINTGATNNFVVAASTGHTVIGNMTVLPNTSGLFRSRRTDVNTWITYRVS